MRLVPLRLQLLYTASTLAQTCYYPNGNTVSNEEVAPCGSSAQCCPLNWVCMSNGLCHYPPQDFLGRYSCADKSWKDSSCPNYCLTENGSAGGNQAILKCDNGQYCCDGNRSFDCCAQAGTLFFSLPDPQVVMTISAVPAASSSAPKSSSSSRSGSASSIVQTGSASSAAGSPATSDPANTGAASQTSDHGDPMKDSDNASDGKTSWKLIVGIVLGVVAAIALIALIHVLLLRRRRHRRQSSASESGTKPVVPGKKSFSDRVSWITRSPLTKSPSSRRGKETSLVEPVSELHGAPVASYPDAVELPTDAPTPRQLHQHPHDLARTDTYTRLTGAAPTTYVPFHVVNSDESASQHLDNPQHNFPNPHPSPPEPNRTTTAYRASTVSSLTPSEQAHPSSPYDSSTTGSPATHLSPNFGRESVTAWQQPLPVVEEYGGASKRLVSSVLGGKDEVERPFSLVSVDALDGLRPGVHELCADEIGRV